MVSSERIYSVYENRENGKRIFYPGFKLTNSQRSAMRFKRKAVNACRDHGFKLFGTLTYADEFLPFSSKHVSEFFMRWRKHNTRLKDKKSKVEYMWRQDYGEEKGRPHYHFLATEYIDLKNGRLWWGRGFIWVRKIWGLWEVRKYLNKYMCKPDEIYIVEKQRRCGSSRGISKCPKSKWKLHGWTKNEGKENMVYSHNRNLGLLDNYLDVKKSKV